MIRPIQQSDVDMHADKIHDKNIQKQSLMEYPPPHVVILPFPAQGHIKPMLMLAELLSRAGITISFVNNHRRIHQQQHHAGIKFLSIPDGLPLEHPRTGMSVLDLFFTISTVSKPFFYDLIASMTQRPSCIISDGIMSFAIDVAEQLHIPAITFRTYSATCTWIYFHLNNLIQLGEIPLLEGKKDMDELICCIPGLEKMIRRRDLPSICKLQTDNKVLQFYINQTSKMKKASALILNTFEELEYPIISHLHSIFPTVYAIGPLTGSDSTSLMQTDQSCIEWLDSQQPKSVVYVSFGSVVELSPDEVMEFWYGLVNSGKPFLWAIRPDLVWDEAKIPEELIIGTELRGRIVGWVPQEQVLAHYSVGGFLTHSGWNSTLESICAGKPMICWPRIADQHANSRCVSEMWKVGIDMKDICDRSTVEIMVKVLMEGRRDDIVESTDKFARFAQDTIMDGGSSCRNLKKLIQDIHAMSRAI